MKYTIYLSLACSIGFIAGCAYFNRPNILLDPVGPPPRSVGTTDSPDGWLVVYSAWGGGGPPGESSDTPVNHHSDYKIYSSDGKLFKTVNNWTGTYSDDPATVSLLPGRYTVATSVSSLQSVTVPVVIETGKTTSVHLDGSELTAGGQTSTNDFVRLPDGSIIGWRAPHEAESK